MKPSHKAIKAAEDAYRKVWSRGPVSDALSANSVEVALEAAYAIDVAPLLERIENSCGCVINKKSGKIIMYCYAHEQISAEIDRLKEEYEGLLSITSELAEARKQLETLRNAVCGKCGRALPPDGDCFGCSYDRVLSNGTTKPIHAVAVELGLRAEIERLSIELERLRSVGEWLCVGCNTVYPGPPREGFSCVVCPRCGGDCGPFLIMRNRLLTAELVEARKQQKPPDDPKRP